MLAGQAKAPTHVIVADIAVACHGGKPFARVALLDISPKRKLGRGDGSGICQRAKEIEAVRDQAESSHLHGQ